MLNSSLFFPFRIAILSCVCILYSCVSKKQEIVFSANCDNATLELALVHRTNFDSETWYNELWYNNKKVTDISNLQLNNRLPYSPEIYGNAAWQYFDTTAKNYAMPGFAEPIPLIRCMLYVDSKSFTQNEFDMLAKCLQENMPALQKVIDSNTVHFQPYKIAGLVYGTEETFIQRYKKDKNNTIEIYPDGNINHINRDGAMITTSSNGLGQKVSMPGKRIAVLDTNQITMQQLKTYRHTKTGRTIAEDFELYYDIHPQSR